MTKTYLAVPAAFDASECDAIIALAGEMEAAPVYGAGVRQIVRGERQVTLNDPELSGVRLANDLRPRGATELLARLRSVERVPSPQPE